AGIDALRCNLDACAAGEKLNDLGSGASIGWRRRRSRRFLEILGMSTLLPHGACLSWKPELIWLNVVSDALLACAFFSIAFVLALMVWRRRSQMLLRFNLLLGGVAVFGALGGLGRLLAIVTMWVPAYGLEAAVKGVQAPASAAMAAAFFGLLPYML